MFRIPFCCCCFFQDSAVEYICYVATLAGKSYFYSCLNNKKVKGGLKKLVSRLLGPCRAGNDVFAISLDVHVVSLMILSGEA